MPSAKSGKASQLVNPAAPREAKEADVADPGEVEKVKAEQVQSKSGKYGQTPVKAHKAGTVGGDSDSDSNAAQEEKKKKTSWIAIQLVDEDSNPVSGMRYQITLPDNTVEEGTLEADGTARVDGIDPGSCKITFPDLDQDDWEKA
jgi:uncharacterized protein (DUF2345 family)